jgi:hypothetical protein
VRLAVALLLLAQVAYAEKPTLAALAPADDARLAIPIGPNGQAYEPDGQGSWARQHAGGMAADVMTATRVAGAVIAGAKDAPPFKLVDGTWTAISLGLHARAILGSGPRATAAVGRMIFALDRTPPARLANAPGIVTALAASATGLVVQTETGVFRLEATGWKPLAVTSVVTFVSDRWGRVDEGVIDLRTNKVWPIDTRIVAATTLADDTLIAVGVTATAVELLTLRNGKLDREALAIDPSATVIGVVADRTGRVVVATSAGRLVIRDHAAWTTTNVRDELPAPRPGPAAAISQ